MAIDGIINVNKPRGITSFKCVSAIRRITGVKKTGHAGTLDPEATGVLPIAVGKATKCSEYFLRMGKSYRAEMIFGISTNTMDVWGETVSENYGRAENITKKQLEDVLEQFRGEIDQIPPAFSAIKKDGVPLYKLARNGVEVKPEVRRVNVYSLELVDFFKDEENHLRAVIDVHCSKGTYIRSICNDIGEKLGVGAAMSALVRTSYGNLKLDDAATLEQLEQAATEGTLGEYVIGIETVLADYTSVEISEHEKNNYIQGKKVLIVPNRVDKKSEYDDICVFYNGSLIAIAQMTEIDGRIWLKPCKFFGE